ncbi:MAG: hypothetical protein Q7T55_06155 [Solirubrobacteraceae bacterium]|nr:hypothetical protein [Solirubrobacteraceae bacterium]
MSYDLYAFKLPPDADPSDYATEVVESFDEVGEPDPSAPSVESIVAVFRTVFPELEVAEEDEESAMLLLEERLVSIDVFPTHCDVCVSYGVPKDAAWLVGVLGRIAGAASTAGHETLFDAQLDRPVLPELPADAAAISEGWSDGLGFVEQMQAEHGGSSGGGGFFKKLLGRR